eukprot:GAFH01001813.1.p12 GENE.GAFH01001813.1~~GAFH01001813.1.p12  ORF type:complete len:51 (+),score=8.48 GAFH01001813.1:436-588(+)
MRGRLVDEAKTGRGVPTPGQVAARIEWDGAVGGGRPVGEAQIEVVVARSA